MGFLDRLIGRAAGADDAGRPVDARHGTDLERLAAGSVPLAAQERLTELAQGRTGFTSNLSVADFALGRLAEVQPVAQVMGSSVYRVGWQNFPWPSSISGGAQSTELATLTAAWNEARRLALSRLGEEARLAGSHAVVDVAFQTNRHEFLLGDIEVVVTGTAVRLRDADAAATAVVTDLSMPDFFLLRRAGYMPIGVVTATTVHYIVGSWQTQQASTNWQRMRPNQELPEFTQGVYAARETVLGRATRQAQELGADGMVGMAIDHRVDPRYEDQTNTRQGVIITFHVLGTAIRADAQHQPLSPRTVVRQNRRAP